MSRRRREFGQQLRFSTIRCRCGGQRLLGQTCTDCGMRPRNAEVDVEVKRRTRIVQQVRTAERMLAADGDAQFDELLDRTSTIIDQVLRPLACSCLVVAGGHRDTPAHRDANNRR